MSVGKLVEAPREQLRSRAPQLETLRRAVGFVARSAPNELRNLVLLNLIFGTGPSLLLWLGKVVIDALAHTAGKAETWHGALRALLSQPNLYLAVSAFVLLHLLLDSAETIGDLQNSMMRDRVEGAAKEQLYRKVSGVQSMAIFEAPKVQDVLHLAERAVGRLQDVSRVVGVRPCSSRRSRCGRSSTSWPIRMTASSPRGHHVRRQLRPPGPQSGEATVWSSTTLVLVPRQCRIRAQGCEPADRPR